MSVCLQTCLQMLALSMHATRATGHRAAMCKTAHGSLRSPVRLRAWILWGFCEASPACAAMMNLSHSGRAVLYQLKQPRAPGTPAPGMGSSAHASCVLFIHVVCCACYREAMVTETNRRDYGTSPARSLSGFGSALLVIRMYCTWTPWC